MYSSACLNRSQSFRQTPRRPSPLVTDQDIPEWMKSSNSHTHPGSASDCSSTKSPTSASSHTNSTGSKHSRSSSLFSTLSLKSRFRPRAETLSSKVNAPWDTAPLRHETDEWGFPKQKQQQQVLYHAPSSPERLHPEIRSFLRLAHAHAQKVYFSGPITRMESEEDLHRDREHRSTPLWVQLKGTTLSIWEMKQIVEANKRGKEVPPTYMDVTDAVR